MKVIKNYFTRGIEEAESLADIFHKDKEQALEATYRGQAEAYRICLNYYGIVEEDIQKFIAGMYPVMEFYKKIYMGEEDSMCYHKRYYNGLYFELRLIMDEIK